MVRMLFTLPQEKVKIVSLPNGKYDITILDNEELVSIPSGESGEISVLMYQYNGNQFRTVKNITEEEILQNIEEWLNYDASNEPTLEQIQHDEDILSAYRAQIENILKEAVNG